MKRIYIATIRNGATNGKITGHYVAVAKNYLEQFPQNGMIAGGPSFADYIDKEHFLLLPYDVPTAALKDKICSLINSMRLFRAAQGHVIIMQQCSVVTSFIAIALFYHRKSQLYLIQYNTEGVSKPLYRILYYFAKNKIDGIICPNERVGKAFGRPYCVVTDYIRTMPISSISYCQKKYDFCMMGTIWPDKGVIEVAKKLQGTKYKVLIVGAVAQHELQIELDLIASVSTNITMILQAVNSDDYVRYIKESRYCILNYRGGYNDRSSGVVLDMIFNGTPVVARRCEATKLIEENGMGFVYDDFDVWNPDDVLEERVYDGCIVAIQAYMEKQHEYAMNLKKFIGSERVK